MQEGRRKGEREREEGRTEGGRHRDHVEKEGGVGEDKVIGLIGESLHGLLNCLINRPLHQPHSNPGPT